MQKHQSRSKNIQVHDYDLRLERIWKRLEKDTSKENIRLIRKYDNVMVNEALAKPTRLKHLEIILNLCRLLNKDWINVSKDDIENLVTNIMKIYGDDSGQETNTTWDHKKILKIFFRWLKFDSRNFRDVGDPLETKNIKVKKVKDKLIREDLLNEADINMILKACGENQRDRGLLACHAEAGTRPSEILNLKIKHVTFDEYGCVIRVDGKTGARTIRLIVSTPDLAKIYGIADSERSLLNKLPNEVQDIDDMSRVKKDFEDKIRNEASGFFSGIKKWNYKRQVNKFDKPEVKLFHKGTRGENQVIDELAKLDDSFHILCGVNMELHYWVTYNGRKNLKSAQMDLVVVCPKGVFMIEVKNWSDRFANNNNSFSPYEQTERAGRVLWVSLQKVIKNIRVTNILLSIKGNLSYNENYRSVYVSSLDGINQFLEKRQDELNEKEIQKIVKSLQKFVTN